jgi:hypothetical protein
VFAANHIKGIHPLPSVLNPNLMFLTSLAKLELIALHCEPSAGSWVCKLSINQTVFGMPPHQLGHFCFRNTSLQTRNYSWEVFYSCHLSPLWYRNTCTGKLCTLDTSPSLCNRLGHRDTHEFFYTSSPIGQIICLGWYVFSGNSFGVGCSFCRKLSKSSKPLSVKPLLDFSSNSNRLASNLVTLEH